ncbi:F-box/LRR-repeat protein At4g14096-like [Camellia sinensis]|uniref:F-box/LRR-repeat protein At4g14096-like n=1 Tax=Camellia sinensis TaxID=4442 RepID=UPI001036D715|nr:F-box/LRR-repeat protein At4g14096-like [Camellia sinensis]
MRGRIGGTWEAFVDAFQEKFLAPTVKEKLRDQFCQLKQLSLSMSEFKATFTSLSRVNKLLIYIYIYIYIFPHQKPSPKRIHNPPSPTRHETLANVDNNGEDRISNLPESILCHILSKLPTKFAAGTAILSTKWNNLFASIPNPTLDIDDSLLLNPHNNTTNSIFINFMNHLFTVTLIDVPTIHKLHLQCHHDYGNSNIDEWVSIALKRNVTGLSLFFNVKNTGVSIPGLFDSTTLVDLLLSQHYGLSVPDSVCLPKLKRLYLDYVGFVDGESFERVVDGCPALEELSLDGVEFQEIEVLCISSSTIRFLLVHNCYHNECEVVMDTQHLKQSSTMIMHPYTIH